MKLMRLKRNIMAAITHEELGGLISVAIQFRKEGIEELMQKLVKASGKQVTKKGRVNG